MAIIRGALKGCKKVPCIIDSYPHLNSAGGKVVKLKLRSKIGYFRIRVPVEAFRTSSLVTITEVVGKLACILRINQSGPRKEFSREHFAVPHRAGYIPPIDTH